MPVLDDDTVETLSARILVEEHRIYPGSRADGARRRLARRRPPIRSAIVRSVYQPPGISRYGTRRA